jgi:tetratricopeptide (TPR) repeat protein
MDRATPDRDRLKDVRQTDLTEGRINQDFVDWLKTRGTTWLLVAMVALFVYAAVVRWRHHRASYQTEAWTALTDADLPNSLEDVAEKYSDVGAVPHLARLHAAGQLLASVQTNKTLGATDQSPLSPEAREDYLNRADQLYRKIVDADNQQSSMALMVFTALNGRAAVAESRGNYEEARAHYEQSAKRVEELFPRLAEHARTQAASVEESNREITLLTRLDVTAMQNPSPAPVEPVTTDPWLNDILTPVPANP